MSETVNQQATDLEIGWLIGFIEGEGSVGLYFNQTRKQIYPILDVVNTEEILIARATEIIKKIGVGVHRYDSDTPGRAHYKHRYDLNVLGIKRLGKLMTFLLPYWEPSKKRIRADIVNEFCKSRLSNPCPENGRYTNYEQELFQRFCALKEGRGGRKKRQSPEAISQSA